MIALLLPVTLIIFFTTMYTSLKSLKSDLNIRVLTHIFVNRLLDESFTSNHLFFTNFQTVKPFNYLDIL